MTRVIDNITTALRARGYREFMRAQDSTGGNVRIFRSGAYATNEDESVNAAVAYVSELPRERFDYEITPDYQDDDEKSLARTVRHFAGKMLDKLIVKKRRDGYHGWNEPENHEAIFESAMSHVERYAQGDKTQLVDVVNLLMMLALIDEKEVKQ